MTKRIVLLAGVVLFVLSAAPDAMAAGCERCRFYPVWGEWACITPPPLLGGYEICNEGGWWCENLGEYCPPQGGGAASLASEYTVASVARLDEPDRGPGETLVAQAETAQPLTR